MIFPLCFYIIRCCIVDYTVLFNWLEICVNCRETDFNPLEIKFNKEETVSPVQVFISWQYYLIVDMYE